MRKKLLMFILVAFILRLVLVFAFSPVHHHLQDDRSIKYLGEYFLEGKNIYPELTEFIEHPEYSFNHLPLWFVWGAVSVLLSKIGLSFGIWYRILFIVLDSFLVGLIYSELLKRSPKNAEFGAWLYLLNPVSLIVNCFAAHVGSYILFFVLLAGIVRNWKISGFLLSAGSAFKILPFILVPNYWWKMDSWKKRIGFGFCVVSIPILSLIPFIFDKGAISSMLQNILGYRGSGSYTGLFLLLDPVLDIGSFGSLFSKITILFLALFYVFFSKKLNLLAAIQSTLLVFVLFSPRFATQYYLWLIPLGVILFPRDLLLIVYGGVHLIANHLQSAIETGIISFPKEVFSTIDHLLYLFLPLVFIYYLIIIHKKYRIRNYSVHASFYK